MKLFKMCFAVCAVLIPVLVNARPPEPVREATAKLASRSIRIGEATGVTASSVTFSTLGTGARFFGNGEFRPSATRAGFHESAYTIFDGETRVEAGNLFVQLPSADANGNGLPDVIDREAAVDISVTAEVMPRSAFVNGRVSSAQAILHLQRNAGSDTGTYTLGIVAGALTGSYSVLHGEGTVQYQRTDFGALLNFDLSKATTNATAVSRVIDSNTVRIAAFRFRVAPTRTVRVGPVTLARSGNVYQGDGNVSDGLTETMVPDFRAYVIQIIDVNDTNTDGVPNFSDALPPFIAAQPTRQIVALGADVVLSVTVEGTGPFTYEWQQNGHELSNAAANPTNRVLVLPNATLADKGSYRVRVSNAAGSVWSDSTSVSFEGQ
jgi:hypothetical protein